MLDILFLLQLLLLLLLFLLLPRALLRVRLQMRVEHRFRGERFVTERARIGSIARVTPKMHHQRGTLGEPFLAVGALVGSFTGVGAPMNTEIILRDEPLAAQIANVWLFAGVFAEMDREVGLAGDRFAAYGAHVLVLRAHVPVCLHVHEQHLLPGETFVAEHAVMFPLRRHVVRLMELAVQPQTLTVTERGVADLALKRFLVFVVHRAMFLVTVPRHETDPADLALVFVLDVVPFLMADQDLTARGHVAARLACVALVRLVLELMLLQRGGGRETATAVFANELILVQLSVALLVHL